MLKELSDSIHYGVAGSPSDDRYDFSNYGRKGADDLDKGLWALGMSGWAARSLRDYGRMKNVDVYKFREDPSPQPDDENLDEDAYADARDADLDTGEGETLQDIPGAPH